MLIAAALGTVALSGCTLPDYDQLPNSPDGWQRRQDGIERREAEAQRLCDMAGDNDEARRRACRDGREPR